MSLDLIPARRNTRKNATLVSLLMVLTRRSGRSASQATKRGLNTATASGAREKSCREGAMAV
jgi:hypothetical protein